MDCGRYVGVPSGDATNCGVMLNIHPRLDFILINVEALDVKVGILTQTRKKSCERLSRRSKINAGINTPAFPQPLIREKSSCPNSRRTHTNLVLGHYAV